MDNEDLKDNIQESFDITLTDSNLESIAENITELSLDCLLNDGVLKDIPIVGMVASLIKLGANIKDKLFLKKIISFLKEIKDVSISDRKRIINKIDNSGDFRIKVGEKLLYIIDNCNDYESSELVARVFKFFIEEKINYDDFLRCASVIEKITKYDFDWFLKNGEYSGPVEDVPSNLIGIGLFGLQYKEGEISVWDKPKDPLGLHGNSKYSATIKDSGVSVFITEIGQLILNIFKSE